MIRRSSRVNRIKRSDRINRRNRPSRINRRNSEVEKEVEKNETESSVSSQWEEIEMDEELSGNQSKIDVAKPKGKITAADFKKLRKDRNEEKDMVVIDVLGGKTKNREIEEYYHYSDEDIEEDLELDDE